MIYNPFEFAVLFHCHLQHDLQRVCLCVGQKKNTIATSSEKSIVRVQTISCKIGAILAKDLKATVRKQLSQVECGFDTETTGLFCRFHWSSPQMFCKLHREGLRWNCDPTDST